MSTHIISIIFCVKYWSYYIVFYSSEKWSQAQRVKGLEGVKIQEAAGSGVVSMAIDVCGQLWAWGKSKRGQLGLGEGKIESQSPQPVQSLVGQHILQVYKGF